MVRSLSASRTASAHIMNSCSTRRLATSSSVIICSRGPGADRVVGQRRARSPGRSCCWPPRSGRDCGERRGRAGCSPHRPTDNRRWPSAGGFSTVVCAASYRPRTCSGTRTARSVPPRLLATEDVLHQPQHSIVPGGTSLFRLIPSPSPARGLLAFEVAVRRKLMGQRCCSMPPESPVALAGPWALSRIACSRSSVTGYLRRRNGLSPVTYPSGGEVSEFLRGARLFLQNQYRSVLAAQVGDRGGT